MPSLTSEQNSSEVPGQGWPFQHKGLTLRQHLYTATTESVSHLLSGLSQLECRDTTRHAEGETAETCQLNQFKSAAVKPKLKHEDRVRREHYPGRTEDSCNQLGQNLSFLCFIYLFAPPHPCCHITHFSASPLFFSCGVPSMSAGSRCWEASLRTGQV